MSLLDWFRRDPAMRGLRKAFTFTPIDAATRSSTLPRTSYDYATAVRNGLDSNVVMAPVQWIMRTFPEAELIAERRADRQWRRVEDHPLEMKLAAPNPFYGLTELEQATVLSWFMDGNAYWIVAKSALLEPLEFWYVPHWMMEPQWSSDGQTFITHYEYSPDGQRIALPVSDVVHLRFGLDPCNTRKGLSPLKALMREVFTDDEAANFSAAILKNMGIPGVVISPKNIETAANPEDVQETKDYLKSAFSGDKRGEPLVMGAPTEVKQFGFDPNQLMLANIRDIAEERVCAALGVPAAVVGFGAGLQQTKVGATMRELRRLAWLQCLIPTQRSMAQQLARQLLPQVDTEAETTRLRFDTSNVSGFQEEETEKAKRIASLVANGILRVDRAQEAVGVEVDETQQVYLRPSNAVAIGQDGAQVDADLPPSVRSRLRSLIIDVTGNGDEGA